MPCLNFTNQKCRGVAVLLAVLLVSVVLVISLVLLNITYRQLIISNTARESEIAWYAAESIFNCARYWDAKGEFVSGVTTVNCAGDNLVVDESGLTYTFYAGYQIGDVNTCAKAEIKKDSAANQTTITAFGYNNRPYDSAGNGSCGTPGPRTVERALQTEYQG